ncbi:MAG: hypothetical protein QM744_19965 [Mesorhizobium sp.]
MNGFGRALAPESNGAMSTGANLANGYIKLVYEGLQEARSNPYAAAAKRRECVAFARRNYNWNARAQQWIALAQRYISGSAGWGRFSRYGAGYGFRQGADICKSLTIAT